MFRRYKIIVFSLIILVVLVISILLFMDGETAIVPDYSPGKIMRGNLKAEVSTTGTLSPVTTIQVGSQVSGTIRQLYADFNSVVKKGQIIAQIDPAIFNARLAEAEADVRSNQAMRDKAWVDVQETRNTFDRVEGLFKKKLASDSKLDEARFAYKVATVEHQVKEAAVAKAKAVLQREQVNLAYTTIYAPIDGVVISRDVGVGQTVAASLQAPTLFTIAHDLGHMQIETEVDEAFIGKIKEQQPVSFSVFAYQDRYFTGRVSQVRLQPKVESGVVKYNCIIQVDNPDFLLKPGMTASVAIEVERKSNVLKILNSALNYVPDLTVERLKEFRTKLKNNEGVIWVPEGSGLKPLKIQMGVVGERETEVIGEGLTEGMTIALPPKNKKSKKRKQFGFSLF